MLNKKVTKIQLEKVLTDWGQGRISSEQLQDWMVDNYDPTEIEVGPGEPELVQQAMNLVMNEYELAKIDTFVVTKYDLALKFINYGEGEFAEKAAKFLRLCFTD